MEEPFVTGIDHRLPPIQAQRSKALAKKSRSTTSCKLPDLRVQLRYLRVAVRLNLKPVVLEDFR